MARPDYYSPLPPPAIFKLYRAEEHINQLKSEVDKFLSKEPYRFAVEYDKDRTHGFVVIRVRENPPFIRWSILIGDAIHNLRVALDYMVCQLIVSGKSQIGRHSGFPIYRTLEAYNSGKSANIKGICPRAEQIIDRLKPYGGGIESYWRLHQIDIDDKHRFLLAAIDMPSNIKFKPSPVWAKWVKTADVTFYSLPNPIKDGTKVLSFPVPPEAREENFDPSGIDSTWDIRLHNPPEVAGRFISQVFDELHCTVKKTIRILSKLI